MFDNYRRQGKISLENGQLIIQCKRKRIPVAVEDIIDIKLKKRWGRERGGIWFIPVQTDSNLYGYQAVVITKRKKYYINSMDIGFGKYEKESREAAEEFARSCKRIAEAIKKLKATSN